MRIIYGINITRYVDAHKIKERCDFLEKTEIQKHMELKENNFKLKSENLIRQQTLEKNALLQKMNAEYDEMSKIKQQELDKIIVKYKNKKFELESRQGKEKNLHDNENLLKANLFNNNLANFISSDNAATLNKSMNKTFLNKNNFLLESKLKDINCYSKRSLEVKSTKLPFGNMEKKRSSVTNFNTNTKNAPITQLNKSLKSLNISSGAINCKDKPAFVRNLQYSSGPSLN